MEQFGPPGQQPEPVVYNKDMNRKKILLLFAIFVVLILISFFLVNYFNNKNKKEIGTPTYSPVPSGNLPTSSTSFQKPKGQKIVISGIEVNNFYNKNPQINQREDVTFVDTSKFQILYFSQENEFLISIMDSPFETVRLEAERQFLKELGINEENACGLKVTISTPGFVNPEESGRNYKLSFCQE